MLDSLSFIVIVAVVAVVAGERDEDDVPQTSISTWKVYNLAT